MGLKDVRRFLRSILFAIPLLGQAVPDCGATRISKVEGCRPSGGTADPVRSGGPISSSCVPGQGSSFCSGPRTELTAIDGPEILSFHRASVAVRSNATKSGDNPAFRVSWNCPKGLRTRKVKITLRVASFDLAVAEQSCGGAGEGLSERRFPLNEMILPPRGGELYGSIQLIPQECEVPVLLMALVEIPTEAARVTAFAFAGAGTLIVGKSDGGRLIIDGVEKSGTSNRFEISGKRNCEPIRVELGKWQANLLFLE